MMKKYFSLTLLLAMVLTLVSTVPAQAALDNTYPYIFLDYNQGFTKIETKPTDYLFSAAGTKRTIEWANGEGVGGSGAIKITDTTYNDNDDTYQTTLQDKESIQRDSYTISGWIKFDHADKYDHQGNIIDENGDGNPDQWTFASNLKLGTILDFGYTNKASNFSNISIQEDLTDGKWHYVTQTYAPNSFTNGDNGGTYDWTTNKPINFGLRFLSGGSSESRFFQIFQGFYRYKTGTTSEHKSSGDTLHRGELVYYIDDYQYTPTVSDPGDGSVPVVTPTCSEDIDTNLVGDTIHISWTHTPTSTDTPTITSVSESKVVVRVFKKVLAGGEYATNGWALVDQKYVSENSFDYPLTEAMLGDTYKFEVFPYDSVVDSAGRSTYRAGAIKTFTMKDTSTGEEKKVSKAEIVTPAAAPITFISGERKISFTLDEVTNNKTTPLQLFTIIALYDNYGALIGCDVNPLSVPNGGSLTEAGPVTHTTDTIDADVYNKVKTARAFVWSGTGFDEGVDHVAYTSVCSKNK